MASFTAFQQYVLAVLLVVACFVFWTAAWEVFAALRDAWHSRSQR